MVDHTFWLSPGHASEPGTWYAGTSPQGLFRSEDDGATWAPAAGFNDHPMYTQWTGGEKDGTPEGLHCMVEQERRIKRVAAKARELVGSFTNVGGVHSLRHSGGIHAKHQKSASGMVGERRQVFGQPSFVDGQRRLPVEFVQLMPRRREARAEQLKSFANPRLHARTDST